MFPTKEVLSVSAAAHRINEGFIKKDQVRFDEKHKNKTCNSDLLYNHFYREKEKLQVLEKDIDLAEIIIDYLKGLSFKAIERELTDFEKNVLKLVSNDTIQKDKIGISASLPKVYLNKIEQDAWTDREHILSATSSAQGKLHQRETFDVVIEFCRYIPRTMSYLVTTSIDNKHILKFFHDKQFKVGSKIKVDGYVKSQGRGKYHNGQETIINRIKVHKDK
mgnify:CR=1 FL=1